LDASNNLTMTIVCKLNLRWWRHCAMVCDN